MDADEAIEMLGALAQETRLEIVRYLIRRGDQGASAGEVAGHLEASASRASFHLSTLQNAGVLTSERRSRQIIYRPDSRNLGGLIAFLLNDCCDNHPDILACCLPKDGCC